MNAKHNRSRNGLSRAFRIASLVLAILLVLFAALVAAFFIMRQAGENELKKPGQKPSLPTDGFRPYESVEGFVPNESLSPSDSADDPSNDVISQGEEADVYYKGEAYNYNDSLINILVLGVDAMTDEDGSVQADSLYLVVLDEVNKKIDVISISRNTIATVSKFDLDGNLFGKTKTQICLAYSYGSTPEESAELTMESVSSLFYGLPISGYYTLFMDGVPEIVRTLGNVEVTVPEDLDGIFTEWVAGQKAYITPENALLYLRLREEYSNEVRLSRHKDFLMSLYNSLKSQFASNPSLPLTLYQNLSDYSTTDLSANSAVYLAGTGLTCSFGGIRSLKGTPGLLFGHEAIAPDEQALFELILDVFYTKVPKAS